MIRYLKRLLCRHHYKDVTIESLKPIQHWRCIKCGELATCWPTEPWTVTYTTSKVDPTQEKT